MPLPARSFQAPANFPRFTTQPLQQQMEGDTEDSADQSAAPTFTQVDVGDPPPAPDRQYTEADINRARREEKDKLYPELQSLKEQVNTLTAAQQAELDRQAEQQRLAQEQQQREAEEEMSARQLLETRTAELQAQIAEERQARENAMAMLEQERRFAELQAYRTMVIEQNRDDIIPELIDLVAGNTREEVDASIAGLRERSSRILGNIEQAQQSARQNLTGARVTAPSAGPLDDYTGQRTFTPDEIRNMSQEDWAKHRATFLGAGAEGGQGKGLFGG